MFSFDRSPPEKPCGILRLKNGWHFYAIQKLLTLSANLQAIGKGHVALVVTPAQILQQAATLPHQPQQPAAGGNVPGVYLQMVGQLFDAAGEKGHLDLGGSSVAFGAMKLLDNLGFLFFG
jgi:hypothetical protein